MFRKRGTTPAINIRKNYTKTNSPYLNSNSNLLKQMLHSQKILIDIQGNDE